MSPYPDEHHDPVPPYGPTLWAPPSVPLADCRVVRAHGELDLATVPTLEAALRRARTEAGRPFLIVDLNRVTFADGCLIDPLCEAWADCEVRHGWVRVVRRHSAVARVFRISGLDSWFPAFASVRDAWLGTAAAPGPGLPVTWERDA
ncbi:STAS domain-containing protein [Streptomyces sp. WG-D5]